MDGWIDRERERETQTYTHVWTCCVMGPTWELPRAQVTRIDELVYGFGLERMYRDARKANLPLH